MSENNEKKEYDQSWLEEFLVQKDESKQQPDDERRLSELDRMKSAASEGPFSGMVKTGLSKLDKDKYLAFCELFESEAKFTCSAPQGWEEEYIRHMQERIAKYGVGDPSHCIKPNGRKRPF